MDLTTMRSAAVELGSATAAVRGGSRPASSMIRVSVPAGERGVPRTDAPALATLRETFRIKPTAADGIMELRLADDRMIFFGAKGPDGRQLEGTIRGHRLLLQRPAAGGQVTVHTAIASRPGGALRLEVDRLHLDELSSRIVSGAETVPPPPHFRTGKPQPDETRVQLNFDERGWEVSRTSMPRSAPDYVHPLDETLQAHFAAPRETPFTATAQYTGRVGSRAAEGPLAELRRGARRTVRDVGGRVFHALEQRSH